MTVWLTLGIYAAAIAVLALAALSDVRSLTIPNRFVLALIGLWVLATAVPPWPGPLDLGLQVATAAAFFALALALFAFNLLGGGDGKLLAALGLWTGPQDAFQLLILIAVAGGAVAIVMLLSSLLGRLRARGDGASTVRQELHRQIPYGVAIALGGMVICGQRMGALAATGL